MRFSELKIGQTARITAVLGEKSPYRQRLIAMGLLPGTTLTVLRMAPLGDPLEIRVRGVALSLRKQEANLLTLEQVSQDS